MTEAMLYKIHDVITEALNENGVELASIPIEEKERTQRIGRALVGRVEAIINNQKAKQTMPKGKAYTLYAWRADDEGGWSICKRENFSPQRDYYPESGWRAQPSQRIGDFDTTEELADLIFAEVHDYDAEYTKEEALQEARSWMEDITTKGA